MDDLYSFLEKVSKNSDFNAELCKRGGFITFSNSGKRGGIKYFQIGLDNILRTLKDILEHLDVFSSLTKYKEKEWRDNGSVYFTDSVANANSTVQTKPLFSTLSKVIIWGNQPLLNDVNPDEDIVLDDSSLKTAIGKLEIVANGFTPRQLGIFHQPNLEFQNNEKIFSLLTALRTKPFVLLAGISGTGKSQKVQELAFMTCPDGYLRKEGGTTPGNYCLVEVKPNWHDSTDLLGYYSALSGKYELTDFIRFVYKATKHSDVPFFLCLDEMNLAPVEQYFAEFLSVLETRKKVGDSIQTQYLLSKDRFSNCELKTREPKKRNAYNVIDDQPEYDEKPLYSEADAEIICYLKENGLTLPDNLFVIGTVNMDDTTHQFSRKVIDRAFTIEMNGGKMADMFGAESRAALEYREKPVGLYEFKSQFVRAYEVLEDGRFAKYADIIKERIPALLGNSDGTAATDSINGILNNTPFRVSYRVQNELIIYLSTLIERAEFPEDIDGLISEAILTILLEKILPRVQGEQKQLETKKDGKNSNILKDLKSFVERHFKPAEDTPDALYNLVVSKLDEMDRKLDNYYTNFF